MLKTSPQNPLKGWLPPFTVTVLEIRLQDTSSTIPPELQRDWREWVWGGKVSRVQERMIIKSKESTS